MMDRQQQLWETVDRQRERYIGFLQELIRLSEGGEESTQRGVAGKFEDIGCEVEVIKYEPRSLSLRHEFTDPDQVDAAEHISAVGRLRGKGDGRSLLLFAQGDTMPIQGLDSWTRDPFAGEIEDGRLYGWAAADDLAGVAGMTCALEALLAAGLKPEGDVILASTPSKKRARGIIAVLEHGYEADGVVYVHPAESGLGLGEIKAAAAGLMSFQITVPGRLPPTGEPGHTAFHHLAVDPLDKAWLIYHALAALNERRGREVHHAAFDEAVGRSTNLHVAHISCGRENLLIRVAPECVLGVSVTLPPGERLADLQAEISRTVEEAANRDDWLKENPPTIKWLSGTTGTEISTDHPLYQTASRAIVAVTGCEPVLNPMHTASDIRNPMLFNNIPTVGLGPLAGNLVQIGGHDEWIHVDEYVRTLKVVASIIVDWCGAK